MTTIRNDGLSDRDDEIALDAAEYGVTASPPSTRALLYAMGLDGYIYSYTIYPGAAQMRFFGSVLVVAPQGDERTMSIDGATYCSSACLVSCDTSQLDAEPVPTVSFIFSPHTDVHRALQQVSGPRVVSIAASDFAALRPQFAAALSGAMDMATARKLYADVRARCLARLPAVRPLDQRLELVVRALTADPAIPVDKLGELISLSPDRLSHLFTEEIGVDLRRYRVWLKVGRGILLRASNPSMNLTDVAQLAGFSDSAHMSRSFKEMYGGSPSEFDKHTEIRLDFGG